MLTWRYVIDMKGQRKKLGRKMTVFAETTRSFVDLPDDSSIHEGGWVAFESPKTSRAFDCMTANRLPMCK